MLLGPADAKKAWVSNPREMVKKRKKLNKKKITYVSQPMEVIEEEGSLNEPTEENEEPLKYGHLEDGNPVFLMNFMPY